MKIKILIIFLIYTNCVISNTITDDTLRDQDSIEREILSEDANFFINYTQRNGFGENSIIDFVTYVISPKGSDYLCIRKYKKVNINNYLLIKEDTIMDEQKMVAIEDFINNFKLMEKGKCFHFYESESINPPSGSLDYNIGYSRNEWSLTLVKKEDDGYAYYFSFKHKIRNRCLTRKENKRMRRRFKKFKKLIVI